MAGFVLHAAERNDTVMGVYDEYAGIQLKVGPCCLAQYDVGDKVEIPDGVYVGHSGVVVILDGKFVGEFGTMISKWGNTIYPEEVLYPHDAVRRVIEETP